MQVWVSPWWRVWHVQPPVPQSAGLGSTERWFQWTTHAIPPAANGWWWHWWIPLPWCLFIYIYCIMYQHIAKSVWRCMRERWKRLSKCRSKCGGCEFHGDDCRVTRNILCIAGARGSNVPYAWSMSWPSRSWAKEDLDYYVRTCWCSSSPQLLLCSSTPFNFPHFSLSLIVIALIPPPPHLPFISSLPFPLITRCKRFKAQTLDLVRGGIFF